MSFHVKCKACGKTFHGWVDINICTVCGGKLEDVKKVNFGRTKKKKILEVLRILREIFRPRPYRMRW